MEEEDGDTLKSQSLCPDTGFSSVQENFKPQDMQPLTMRCMEAAT
jgi:hypothetical protein